MEVLDKPTTNTLSSASVRKLEPRRTSSSLEAGGHRLELPGGLFVDIPEPVPAWWETAVDALGDFLQLPYNWNSYKAHPVSKAAVVDAIDLMLYLADTTNLPEPALFPMVRGGVKLEWHTEQRDLEIGVLGHGRVTARFEDEARNLEQSVDLNLGGDVSTLHKLVEEFTAAV